MLNKFTVLLFVLFVSLVNAQNKISEPDINNLDKYIQEVFVEHKDVLAPKDSEQYAFLKDYLKRIEYLDYLSLDQINSTVREITPNLLASTYTELNFDKNVEPKNFNPLKFKLDYANNIEPVYYYINEKFIIKINPL